MNAKLQEALALKVEYRRIAERFQDDLEGFCRYFFPEIFFTPFDEIQRQIAQTVSARNPDGTPLHKKIVIKTGRGGGKSKVANFGYSAFSIAYRRHMYIVPIGVNEESMIEQSDNLKSALETNETFCNVFGNIRDMKGKVDDYSKGAWVAWLSDPEGEETPGYYGTKVLPRGSDQPVRGRGFRQYRPTLVIGDDIEDPKTIKNDRIRDDRLVWWDSDVMKCTPQDPEQARWAQVVFIGTQPNHPKSLINELMARPDWFHLDLPLCTPGYKSNAPSRWTDNQIYTLMEQHKVDNQLDVFAREFQGLPVSKESAPFKNEYFKYYVEDGLRSDPTIDNIVIGDYATTTKGTSNENAIVTVGVKLRAGRISQIRVRDVESGRWHPDEYHTKLVDAVVRSGAKILGVEDVHLKEYISTPIRQALDDRGVMVDLRWLQTRRGEGEFSGPGGGKEARIAGLLPFYRQGLIFHNPACCGPLELQLLRFPANDLLDIIDAFSYIIEIIGQSGLSWDLGAEAQAERARFVESQKLGTGKADTFDLRALPRLKPLVWSPEI